LVVRARRAVVRTDGEVRAVSVAVRDGAVVQIAPYDDPPSAVTRVDLPDDQVLIPGLVDGHVHINEPGAPSGRVSQLPRAQPPRGE
jgi:allantoinase